ncbi:hypothetical protein E2562_034127, partial [Oryza meyeriana var. granulata]
AVHPAAAPSCHHLRCRPSLLDKGLPPPPPLAPHRRIGSPSPSTGGAPCRCSVLSSSPASAIASGSSSLHYNCPPPSTPAVHPPPPTPIPLRVSQARNQGDPRHRPELLPPTPSEAHCSRYRFRGDITLWCLLKHIDTAKRRRLLPPNAKRRLLSRADPAAVTHGHLRRFSPSSHSTVQERTARRSDSDANGVLSPPLFPSSRS